ncbi:unnamed protein product [Effrenium voratum]|nr:unnamed protein product [Effrenium voratum]
MLGVGVSRQGKNLGTAAELLSKEAYDGGLRQNTNKSSFEFFLPVWINEAHAAANPQWKSELSKQVNLIGSSVFAAKDEDGAIMEVFPRLINQMIVEMMRPDASKSAAIATFEALCNFWRTFRWLVDTRPALRSKAGNSLTRFVWEEARRHKDQCPDLGALLVLFTVLQGDKSCPSRQQFLAPYVDENSLRWVMWWQRSGTKPESAPVFQATQVSREILMFQLAVVDLVIGETAQTMKEMEQTNFASPPPPPMAKLWKNIGWLLHEPLSQCSELKASCRSGWSACSRNGASGRSPPRTGRPTSAASGWTGPTSRAPTSGSPAACAAPRPWAPSMGTAAKAIPRATARARARGGEVSTCVWDPERAHERA